MTIGRKANLQIEQMYDTMKGTMTDTPNTRTKKGRTEARTQGLAYDVTVRNIRYTYSPEQAEQLAAQIPETEDHRF